MERIAVAAALGATCCASAVAAFEYEMWEDAAVGASCEVPAGYEVWVAEADEAFGARTARLEWGDGSAEGLALLVVRREARYDNAAVAAGLFQRRIGASASFEAEGEALGSAELAAAGASEGVRAAYTLAGGEGGSRLEVLFLAAGDRRYRVEVSYPLASELQLGAAADRILESFKIMPAQETVDEDAAEAGGAGEEAPTE